MRHHFITLILLLSLGCAVSPMPVLHPGLEKERFTRVNFRPQNQQLYSANYLASPSSIPAGTPAKITLYSPSEIHISLNGVEYTMYPSKGSAFEAQSFPVDDAGIEAFLAKYFIEKKADLKLESLGPPELNEKVSSGLQMIGMTKEQTYVCLGPPIQIDNGVPTILLPYEKILASDRWIYPNS